MRKKREKLLIIDQDYHKYKMIQTFNKEEKVQGDSHQKDKVNKIYNRGKVHLRIKQLEVLLENLIKVMNNYNTLQITLLLLSNNNHLLLLNNPVNLKSLRIFLLIKTISLPLILVLSKIKLSKMIQIKRGKYHSKEKTNQIDNQNFQLNLKNTK